MLLGFGADGADDGGADRLEPLDEDQPDAARCGVDEHRPARLDLCAAFDERLDSAGLEQGSRRDIVVDGRGELEQRRRLDEPRARIGAAFGAEGHDAIAGFEAVDAFADGNDLTRRFEPQPAGKVDGIGAVAVINIDIVEPDRSLADECLSGAGFAQRDLAPVDDLGAALALDKCLNRLHAPSPASTDHLGRGLRRCKACYDVRESRSIVPSSRTRSAITPFLPRT